MGRFSSLSTEQLQAEIAEYRAAIKTATLGGGVGRVAGEGRMMEIVRPNLAQAQADLRDLLAELARRPGFANVGSGGAIGVEIG